MRRHTEEEIQAYFRPSQFETNIGKHVQYVVGSIFFSVGLFMGFMFYITGLLELAGLWLLLFPAMFGGIGLLLILSGLFSGREKSKTQLAFEEELDSEKTLIKRVIREGQIIEATIDEVYENYGYQINGMPETTFFLSFGFEKIRFKTFSHKIIPRYRHREKIHIYYHKAYPDVILPYDNLGLRMILENYKEYRDVKVL